jgi:glutathione synthase/RimK-type ligase-like ATP-grasp enzyme
MIYIDAGEPVETWKHIAKEGGYKHYKGRAEAGDMIIRWGANHCQYVGTYPANVRVLNAKLWLSKVDQARLFEEHDVPMPKVYWSTREWRSDGNPQLIIKPAFGQMGTGIRKIQQPTFRSNDAVYQLYMEKEREFRAMMVGKLMAFFMEKHAPENGDFRWNEHRGAEWTTVGEDPALRKKIRTLGHQALSAIGYDFGAVDIILKDTHLYVLEVNSRPEFGARNAQCFVRAIAEFLVS